MIQSADDLVNLTVGMTCDLTQFVVTVEAVHRDPDPTSTSWRSSSSSCLDGRSRLWRDDIGAALLPIPAHSGLPQLRLGVGPRASTLWGPLLLRPVSFRLLPGFAFAVRHLWRICTKWGISRKYGILSSLHLPIGITLNFKKLQTVCQYDNSNQSYWLLKWIYQRNTENEKLEKNGL